MHWWDITKWIVKIEVGPHCCNSPFFCLLRTLCSSVQFSTSSFVFLIEFLHLSVKIEWDICELSDFLLILFSYLVNKIIVSVCLVWAWGVWQFVSNVFSMMLPDSSSNSIVESSTQLDENCRVCIQKDTTTKTQLVYWSVIAA